MEGVWLLLWRRRRRTKSSSFSNPGEKSVDRILSRLVRYFRVLRLSDTRSGKITRLNRRGDGSRMSVCTTFTDTWCNRALLDTRLLTPTDTLDRRAHARKFAQLDEVVDNLCVPSPLIAASEFQVPNDFWEGTL
jgi:hypothetical protein